MSTPTTATTATSTTAESGVATSAAESSGSEAATESGSADDCAAYLDSLATIRGSGGLAAEDPLRARTDVYGAFRDRAAREAPRTQACCRQEIEARGADAPHRFECCSALQDETLSAACTPWGPPCPPEMPSEMAPRAVASAPAQA